MEEWSNWRGCQNDIESYEESIAELEEAIEQVDTYDASASSYFEYVEQQSALLFSMFESLSNSFQPQDMTFTLPLGFIEDLADLVEIDILENDGSLDVDKFNEILGKEELSEDEQSLLNGFLKEPLEAGFTGEDFKEAFLKQVDEFDPNYHELELAQRHAYVLIFEEKDSTYKDAIDEFLGPAHDGTTIKNEDNINMIYQMYRAEEPYRSFFLDNLGELHIHTWKSGDGQYYSDGLWDDGIHVNIDTNRNDPRGPYITVFHEAGHILDHKLGPTFGKLSGGSNGDLQNNLEDDYKSHVRESIQQTAEDLNLAITQEEEDSMMDMIFSTDKNPEMWDGSLYRSLKGL